MEYINSDTNETSKVELLPSSKSFSDLIQKIKQLKQQTNDILTTELKKDNIDEDVEIDYDSGSE